MNKSVLGCCAAGFALLMIFGIQTQAADANASEGFATVVRLHGKARVSNDNKTWQTLKKNMTLRQGAVIQTAEDSTLDIQLGPISKSSSAEPAEGIVRLLPGTVLGIDRLSGEAGQGTPLDVELNLQAGQIAGRVGQVPMGSHYEVKFARGIAGVRSGIYHISSTGDVAVPTGETVVVIVNNEGNANSTVVTSGKRFDAMSGSMSEIPRTSETPSSPPPPASKPNENNPRGPGLGGSLRNF